MGLRCLLGHDFGEIEVEREREEEGDEMVVTVREVKTCVRCDHRQIVSENKEVTSIRPPAEATAETLTAGVESEGGSDATPADGAAGANVGADDAEFVDGPAGDASATEAEGASAGSAGSAGNAATADVAAGNTDTDADEGGADDEPGFNDDGFEPPATAEEDDGVILDDDADGGTAPGDRGHGEWPQSDDTHDDAAAGSWPEQEGEDEGFDAESPDGEATDVEFGGGLAPQMEARESETGPGAEAETGAAPAAEETEEGFDAEFVGGERSEADEGFVRAAAAEVGGENAALATEYYCPSCEMARAASGSSMRAGDICPECKTGYVTERER